MYGNANDDPRHANMGVVDAETGELLAGILWADDELGICLQARHTINDAGKVQYPLEGGHIMYDLRFGKIRFIELRKANGR